MQQRTDIACMPSRGALKAVPPLSHGHAADAGRQGHMQEAPVPGAYPAFPSLYKQCDGAIHQHKRHDQVYTLRVPGKKPAKSRPEQCPCKRAGRPDER